MSNLKKRKNPKRSSHIEAGSDLSPDVLLNCELSWLEFNGRVLAEAMSEDNPLLERVKFLSIHASNLDEFFMIRVSGLRRLMVAGSAETSPDGLTAAQQLDAIRRSLLKQLARQETCWEGLFLQLHEVGIGILRWSELTDREQEGLREYFEREIFPVLTPLAFNPSHPFPHISNLSLNLAVLVKDAQKNEHFARVKVPDLFPRLVTVEDATGASVTEDAALSAAPRVRFVWLEDVIAANLDRLFIGMNVLSAYPFRVTRDADLEFEEDEASDLLASVEESVEMREWGSGVRLVVDKTMPPRIRELLVTNLGVPDYLVYACGNPIGMADLRQIAQLDYPRLKDAPVVPAVHPSLGPGPAGSIFEAMRKQDILLYHPYDSFSHVTDFIREAAHDPKVLAIKQTLYRIGPNSPIVDALLEARENGKQVAVLMELKARFDEEHNIAWARKLEDEGIHVAYGLLGLKTHAKICLVVRREPEGIVRYVHMSTGNYNPVTAKVYADISMFTTDPDVGADTSDLFNVLTGYSNRDTYRKLLVGPSSLRGEIIGRIDREIQRHGLHGDGHLAFKMNSLVDPECIKALYRASTAGVRVDLQVRGICCLRPGVPGLSENIFVTSIVGRFLEHSRIYYFHNGGEDEVFLGSADLMPRNLERRVEILFPVESPDVKHRVVNGILRHHMQDNQKSWRLLPNGTYERIAVADGGERMNSQESLLKTWHRKVKP